jgi:hypothetical protein
MYTILLRSAETTLKGDDDDNDDSNDDDDDDGDDDGDITTAVE